MSSGFNTFAAIRCINSGSIQRIENFFNDNKAKFADGFMGTEYESMHPFAVIPGHCALIESLPAYLENQNQSTTMENTPIFSQIMKLLIETTENNAGRNAKGKRYQEKLRNFATCIYLLCGRSCYETLSANLPIPSVNAIRMYFMNICPLQVFRLTFTNVNCFFLCLTVGYISEKKCRIIEGELRCSELSRYLDKLKLKRSVWLCEDASGVVAKIEYDPSTNQLVGLVLPLNDDGIPVSFTFMANSAAEIERYAKKSKSTHVYIVLALPLMPNVPPFILQVFGTDNTFTSRDVSRR